MTAVSESFHTRKPLKPASSNTRPPAPHFPLHPHKHPTNASREKTTHGETMQKLKLFILLTLLTAVTDFEQGTTGRLTGTVSGPDGALPGATVVATDNSTGRETTVTANESGTFLFPQLEFGRYTVRVTAAGFKAFVA